MSNTVFATLLIIVGSGIGIVAFLMFVGVLFGHQWD